MSTHGGTSTSAPPATTVTGPDAIGAPAVVGTGLYYARNDHDHGLPILDYNALQYNDLLGWTFDPAAIAGGAFYNPPAAQVVVNRIPLPAQKTVTNLFIYVATLGVTLTHTYVALFKSDGTVIGQSVDQSTAWSVGGATGIYKLPLVGGPYVCTPLAANDFLWAAYYQGTAATSVTVCSSSGGDGGASNAGCTPARTRSGTVSQANTATLASINPGSISPGGNIYWMGIS
jgi:hypothetical protein